MKEGRREGGYESNHPATQGRLPEWLAKVPLDARRPTLIPMGEKGKSVPLSLLTTSLTSPVGATHGSMAIDARLGQLFVQFTENPSWKNLPPEPTFVTRTESDLWEITVGDFSSTCTREELETRIKQTLFPPEEEKKQ